MPPSKIDEEQPIRVKLELARQLVDELTTTLEMKVLFEVKERKARDDMVKELHRAADALLNARVLQSKGDSGHLG